MSWYAREEIADSNDVVLVLFSFSELEGLSEVSKLRLQAEISECFVFNPQDCIYMKSN